MKYLMQILLGLILLQLLQSCDYSKSRDVLWMKKNSTCTVENPIIQPCGS